MSSNFTSTGAPIPYGVDAYVDPGPSEHYEKFGLFRGFIHRTVYPEDAENVTGRLEYIVKIQGQKYYGVTDISAKQGGVFNNHTRVAKDFSEANGGIKVSDSTFDEKKDGEHCWCLFVEGNGNFPRIIGWEEHPLASVVNPDFKKPSKSLGIFERYEFNGVEFLIDKDANFTIKHVGKKRDMRTKLVENTGQGTFLKLGKEGNVTFQIDDGFKTEWNKADDKLSVEMAGGANLELDGAADSVLIEMNGGAKIKADGAADSVLIEMNGGAKIKADGAGDIITAETSGGAKLIIDGPGDAASAETSGGAKVNLSADKVAIGTATAETLDLFDQTIDVIDGVLADIQLITVNTALGPSSPPNNVMSFAAHQVTLATIKSLLGQIKGTL